MRKMIFLNKFDINYLSWRIESNKYFINNFFSKIQNC